MYFNYNQFTMIIRNCSEKFRIPIRTSNLSEFVEIGCLSNAPNYFLKNTWITDMKAKQLTVALLQHSSSSRFLHHNLH